MLTPGDGGRWMVGSCAFSLLQSTARWIGGIVSVDSKHLSRFRATEGGLYNALVVTLQLIAYILAGGAGGKLGTGSYPAQA